MNRQDEYRADNVFWVPAEARWQTLQDNAKPLTIGELIDDIAVYGQESNSTTRRLAMMNSAIRFT